MAPGGVEASKLGRGEVNEALKISDNFHVKYMMQKFGM